MKKLLTICFIILSVHLAKAQEFEGRLFKEFESPRLSILEDPFSVRHQIDNSISTMNIDLDVDPFASKPRINMVAAIERKKQRKNRSLDDFSFIQRQLASFRANKPKIDNSSVELYSPSYNEQPIYSGSNRVKNSVYKDLGDQFKFRTGFRSPHYNRSSSRNRSRNRFYFGAY